MDTSLKLVSAERLSRLKDNSVGIERREAASQRFADAYGHVIIDTAPDTDVSGSVPPWERPGIGPWINDIEKRMMYDGFIFSDLDRLGRNARHISAMRDWAEDNGKKLIIVSPPLQWPPAEGDVASAIIWDVMARLAENELKAITKRNRETQAWLKENGFLVGRWPFGYMAVPFNGNKTLVPDPELTPHVVQIFTMRGAGATLLEVAQWLDAHGVPTQQDVWAIAKDQEPPRKGWSKRTVQQILSNPIYKGQRTDSKGHVTLKVPPIVDAAVWRKAQVTDFNRYERTGRPSAKEARMLKGVIKCGVCGRNMYLMSSPSGPRDADGKQAKIPYYHCYGDGKGSPACKVNVRADVAERYVAEQVAGFGDEQHFMRVLNPGEVHVDEIEDIERQIQELMKDLDSEDAVARFAELRAERQRLIKLDEDVRAEFIDWVPSGKTVGEEWLERDAAGKRQFLLERGCEVQVIRERGTDAVSGKKYNRPLFSISFSNWWSGQGVAVSS